MYAEEIGGEGEHRYVLMCLVALEDPGLTVFPTHRLVRGPRRRRAQEALADALRRDFEIEPVPREQLAPPPGDGPLVLGYIDSHFKRSLRLTLKDQAIADAALPDRSPAYRHLDTGVLEALLLKGPLGLSDEDISHLNGFGYARDTEQARRLVESGEYDAAFLMRPTPGGRRCATWPRAARTCPRSPRTSSPSCSPGCCSTPCPERPAPAGSAAS